MSEVLRTERLALRQFTIDDADFIVRLLNQPSFLEFIGDRGVRTIDDAVAYINSGPLKSYDENGYGLWAVTPSDDNTIMGMAGIMKKPWLPNPDIAYAFLPEYWSRGYAYEAAAAVLEHARTQLSIPTLVAVISAANHASIRIIEKLGFQFDRAIPDPLGKPVNLYVINSE